MSDLTVQLIVAAVAASAVVLAAVIGLWKDRKGRREILLQDLEILDKLPSPSLNHITLAAYIDRRVLLLSFEDKLGVYIFICVTLVIAFVMLAVILIAGFTANHLSWSLLAASLMLTIATLLISYRVFRTKLTGWLQKKISEAGRTATADLVREKVTDSVRARIIEKYEKKFPAAHRTEIMDKATPVIDAEINKVVDNMVSSLLSGNRYSDWSPNLSSSSTAKSRLAALRINYSAAKLNFWAAVLRVLNATLQKNAQREDLNQDDPDVNAPRIEG